MKYITAFVIIVLALSACSMPLGEPQPHFLEAAFPRDNIKQAQISYYPPDRPEGRYIPTGDNLGQLLDILYTATPGPDDTRPMKPSDAVIRLALEAGDIQAECLAGAAADTVDIYIENGSERTLLYAIAPGFSEALLNHEKDALILYTPVPDTEPVPMDPALRAALDPNAFTVPADSVAAEHMTYTAQDKPFYRVISPGDADIAIAEDKVLIIAAYGRRDTEGYSIHIDAVEANETLTRVRVTITTPNQGDWVKQAPCSPVDCVTVSADALPSDCPITFFDQNGKLLYVQAW